MNRIIFTTTLVVLYATSVSAQSTPQTPTEQALASKLMEEINSNIQLRATIIDLRQHMQRSEDAKPNDTVKTPDASSK